MDFTASLKDIVSAPFRNNVDVLGEKAFMTKDSGSWTKETNEPTSTKQQDDSQQISQQILESAHDINVPRSFLVTEQQKPVSDDFNFTGLSISQKIATDDDDMYHHNDLQQQTSTFISSWEDVERMEKEEKAATATRANNTFFRILSDDDNDDNPGDINATLNSSPESRTTNTTKSASTNKIFNNHQYDLESDFSTKMLNTKPRMKQKSVPSFRIISDDDDDVNSENPLDDDDDDYYIGGDLVDDGTNIDTTTTDEDCKTITVDQNITKVIDVMTMPSNTQKPISNETDILASLVKTKPVKAIISMASNAFGSSDPSLYKDKLPQELKEMGKKHPLRVLVVEDNLVVQRTMIRQLQLLGYQGETASNGLDVVKLYQIGRIFDLILMDLHMPGMDGLETCKYIKDKIDPWKKPVIVAVTASESEEESIECLVLGVAHYITKPIPVMQLTNILMKCKMIKEPIDPSKQQKLTVKKESKLTRKKSF